MPEFEINVVAIVVAAVAHLFLGFLWYTPLFGRAWAREMGMDSSAKPTGGHMARGLTMGLVGSILMSWVLFSNLGAWHPESWGQGPLEMPRWGFAGLAAFFTWLGFFVPVDMNTVAWEGRSWKFFAINAGYHLASVTLIAMILAYMW
jgi:hypothetical protein